MYIEKLVFFLSILKSTFIVLLMTINLNEHLIRKLCCNSKIITAVFKRKKKKNILQNLFNFSPPNCFLLVHLNFLFYFLFSLLLFLDLKK